MGLIKGVHHICLKCSSGEEYAKTQDFYGRILGLPVLRSWPTGMMYDAGGVCLEIFNNGDGPLPQGAFRHVAFRVDSVDLCIETVRKEGYAVTVEPKEVVIASQPPFPVRVGFCIGPLGEEIEFFQIH